MSGYEREKYSKTDKLLWSVACESLRLTSVSNKVQVLRCIPEWKITSLKYCCWDYKSGSYCWLWKHQLYAFWVTQNSKNCITNY